MAAIQHHSKGLQFSDNNIADRFDHGILPDQAARLERVRGEYDPEGRFNTYMRAEESTTAYARSRR